MKTQVLSASGCLRLRGGAIEIPRNPLDTTVDAIINGFRSSLLWKAAKGIKINAQTPPGL